MNPETALPNLLMAAWLLPLISFAVISIGYSIPQYIGIRVPYATQKVAAYIAIGAIVSGFLLSSVAMFRYWLPAHPLVAAEHHEAADEHAEGDEHADAAHRNTPNTRQRTTAIRPTSRATGTSLASSATSSSRSATTSTRSP